MAETSPNDPSVDPSKVRTSSTPKQRGHSLGRAILDIPLLAAFGRVGQQGGAAQQDLSLPAPVSGERRHLASPVGDLAFYVAGPAEATPAERPVLLVHSINAAGSAYEVRPIYERLRAYRTVYALELPGFGSSDRSERLYTPRIMTDAILAMVAEIQRHHGEAPIDALAVSLSCEFLARAVNEQPTLFRSLALISPTGFDRRGPYNGAPGTTRAMPALYNAFTVGLWRRPLFDLLTSRVSIRYFLEKTWGSKNIDEGLLDYDYRSTHQPGAEHAPFSFIGGYLFSKDISRVYDSLTLPVWMIHGTRGDFTDYSGKTRVEPKPNWTVATMDAGALLYFEKPDQFIEMYQTFLGNASDMTVDTRGLSGHRGHG